MSFYPISYIAPNYRDYDGWWIKAYQGGTTTPIPIYTDSEGGGAAAKLQINSDGFIVSSGGLVVNPYIEEAYSLYMFPTAEEADNNDTGEAIRLSDDQDPEQILDIIDPDTIVRDYQLADYTTINFDTVANAQSGILPSGDTVTLKEGDFIRIEERGNGVFKGVSSLTANGYNILDFTVNFNVYFELQVNNFVIWDNFGSTQEAFVFASSIASDLDKPLIGSQVTIESSATIESCEVQYIDIVLNANLTHGSNTTFYQVLFSGGGTVNATYDTDKADYILCKFEGGSYINCVAGFNRGPKNITVSLCETNESSLIYGTTLNNSNIKNNIVNATGRSFGISIAGEGNRIAGNESYGGVTGIILIPNRASNKRQSLSYNVIDNNYVHDVDEEGISLDCKGNFEFDGLAVGSTTIATATGDTVTFSDSFPAYEQLNQFVVFQTGSKKGEYYEIIYSGSGGTGGYQLDGYSSDPDDVGETVTVQCGSIGNIISNNTVKDSGREGILVYGSWINTIVENNNTYNCALSAVSLSGIVGEVNTSYQPCHGTTFLNNNVKNEDINVSYIEYNGTTVIKPVSIFLDANKVDSNHNIIIETADVIKERDNNNLICLLNSKRESNGETTLTLPNLEFTSAVPLLIETVSLPSNFAITSNVKVSVGIIQGVGMVESTIVAYRSNETTSYYGSEVNNGDIVKLVNDDENRDIDSISITSTLTSTSTINDSATLDIYATVTTSGLLTTTIKGKAEVSYRITNT